MSGTSAMQVLPTAVYEFKDDNAKTLIVLIVLDKGEALDRSHLHYRQLREHWFIPVGADIPSLVSGTSNFDLVKTADKKAGVEAMLNSGSTELNLKYQFSALTELSSSDWTTPPQNTSMDWSGFTTFKSNTEDLWLAFRFANLTTTPTLEQVAWFAPNPITPPIFRAQPAGTKFVRKDPSNIPSGHFFFDERIC